MRGMLMLLALAGFACGQAADRPPPLTREFRAAWIATVYNIDWPSKKGLPAANQQAELRTMLDRLAALHFNAVIFQVRPECDALYQSAREPWSAWLTGTQGKSPGYDPLRFCIEEAHARGIEVHAWFNPFRARCNNATPVAANHVTRTHPGSTRPYGTMTWCDPASEASRSSALAAVMDVVRRYDVDGVHLDDYFYPYPKGGLRFADGKSPEQRRAYVDDFVRSLYTNVKSAKPWVRVGISPFGIWRPGVPEGIEANLDSYEDLAGDSRKWLKNGWVDYLAPQLYWRISPRKQSFPNLLTWWRQQGDRPVWPGIATARIDSSEDPGRPASEIINQIDISRRSSGGSTGHIHWSAKSLVTNRGGIATALAGIYTQAVAVPAMPWLSRSPPAAPEISVRAEGKDTVVTWKPTAGLAKIAIQARTGGSWRTVAIRHTSSGSIRIPSASEVAATALDRFGTASPARFAIVR